MSRRNTKTLCVEEQILAETPILRGDACESLALFRIDAREIAACLRRIAEENRNDDFTASGWDSEDRDGKNRFDIRDLLLDEVD